jgi:hypothetical protein
MDGRALTCAESAWLGALARGRSGDAWNAAEEADCPCDAQGH